MQGQERGSIAQTTRVTWKYTLARRTEKLMCTPFYRKCSLNVGVYGATCISDLPSRPLPAEPAGPVENELRLLVHELRQVLRWDADTGEGLADRVEERGRRRREPVKQLADDDDQDARDSTQDEHSRGGRDLGCVPLHLREGSGVTEALDGI